MEAIKRGGKLAGKGAVVVKVSNKPNQDMRFDVPSSRTTANSACHARSSGKSPVRRAKRVLSWTRHTFEEAKKADISILGYSG